MPNALTEALKASLKAAAVAGAATGAAQTFPLLVTAVEKLGESFAKLSIGKLLHEVPRERALDLINMLGQAFSRGAARGAGILKT